MEERKEEYNKARARIFNSSSFSGVSSGATENVPRSMDNFQNNALVITKVEGKSAPGGPILTVARV